MLHKLVLTILLISIAQLAKAQDTTLTVTVTHIAGSNVYLNAGTNDGLSKGDTLRVHSGPELLGRVFIESAASQQSVVAFIDNTFSITRGTRLTVTFSKGPAISTPVLEATPAAKEESILSSPSPRIAKRKASSGKGRVRVQGRLLMNFSLLNSETTPQTEGLSATTRTFITPSINLNTTVSNLPSDVKLRLNIRSDYRYNSTTSLSRTNSFRAYQLSLEKNLPFGHLQLGRFYNRLIAAGGYWDGMSFLYGSRKKGIGLSIGFLPDRSNEGFTTQFPRFSGFAHYETTRRSEKPHYRIAVSFHEIQPSSQYQTHKYFGAEQSLNWGPLTLNQDVQLDQEPATGTWIASLFQTHTRVSITKWLDIRGRLTLRQPYRMYSLLSPLSTRREHIQGGLNARFSGASIGANYSARFTQGTYESRTYVAYFNTPVVQPVQLSFFGSGSHWESDFGTALYVNSGLTKSVGAYLFRFDYGFYRSTNNNQVEPIDLHRFTFSATLPFSSKFYFNLRGSLQQSQYLNSLSMNSSLQYRF